MVDSRIKSRKEKFGNRRPPVQARSRQRQEDILATTAQLLDRVGFDDLTTILIASELEISVGSLYHYFPNKQAILHALGEQWLAEYTRALDELGEKPLEEMSLEHFVDNFLNRLLQVYRTQKGVLPLVQAMYAIPELRDLDQAHDRLIIERMSHFLQRLGFTQRKAELRRIGRLWLELTHALFLTIALQSGKRASASFADLNGLACSLLLRHRGS